MNSKQFYGRGIPYLKDNELKGKLIVIEGPDCSGRSTHISMLTEWMEANGYPVLNTGLKRSSLVGGVINEAKKGNILGKTTLSLLYCTDFADQLENKILPALTAGYIVLADRYIFTLMVRDLVRGASKDWLKKLFGFALIPDLTFYLDVEPYALLHRTFSKYGHLDFWESGMDINLSTDMIESFIKYHSLLKQQYSEISTEYKFLKIDGNMPVNEIQLQLKKHINKFLE